MKTPSHHSEKNQASINIQENQSKVENNLFATASNTNPFLSANTNTGNPFLPMQNKGNPFLGTNALQSENPFLKGEQNNNNPFLSQTNDTNNATLIQKQEQYNKQKPLESSEPAESDVNVSEKIAKQSITDEESIEKESIPVQTKLVVGLPNDPNEQEADQIAKRVVNRPQPIQRKCAACQTDEPLKPRPLVSKTTPLKSSSTQRKCATCETEEKLQGKFVQLKKEDRTNSNQIESQISSSRGKGSSLDADTQNFMGERLGANFSNVRIHTDSQSIQMNQDLNAKAFTTGEDIYFNEGEYHPETKEGKELLAHELTHVIQQKSIKSNQTIQRDEKKQEKSCIIGKVQGSGENLAAVNPTDATNVYKIWTTKLEGETQEQNIRRTLKLWFNWRYKSPPNESHQEFLISNFLKNFNPYRNWDTLEVGCQGTYLLNLGFYAICNSLAGESTQVGAGGGQGKGQAGKKESYNAFEKLSDEDKKKIQDLLKEIVGDKKPEEGEDKKKKKEKMNLSEKEVILLLELADNPYRKEIIEKLKSSSPKGEGDDSKLSLEAILATVLAKSAMNRMGVSGGESDLEPIENRPVRGYIAHHDSLLIPEKPVSFYFQVEDDRDALRVPWITIRWRAKLDPKEMDTANHKAFMFQKTETTHYSPIREQGLINDKFFNLKFPEPGNYVIEALVNHNFFTPNAFYIRVAVIDEKKLLREKEDESYKGFTGQTTRGGSYEFDSASFAYSDGTRHTGSLDASFKGLTAQEQLKNLETEKERIEKLLATYKNKNSSEAHQVKEWAEAYLTKLNEYIAKFSKESQQTGTRVIPCRGTYISRSEGVRTSELKLSCFLKETVNSYDEPVYQIILYDYTQLYENDNYRVPAEVATERGAEKAMEEVFVKHSENYPNGTLSLAFQRYDEESKGLKNEFVKYSKTTDTLGKDVKSILFSAPVQIGVNIVSALLTIFPPTAGIGLALGIIYNTASTLSEMQDAADKGTLTGKKIAIGLGSIALDVIPAVGTVSKARRIISIGRKTYLAFELAEKSAMALLMYEQGMEQVENLRNGVIRELAEVNEKIESIKAKNPNDPRLIELSKQQKKLIEDGRKATDKVFTGMIKEQGLMIVGTHILTSAVQHKFGLNKLELEQKGWFQHKNGEGVHYDYHQQKIVGDGNAMSPADLSRMEKRAYYDHTLSENRALNPDERKRIVEKLEAHGDVEIRTSDRGAAWHKEGDRRVLEIPQKATASQIEAMIPEKPTTPSQAPKGQAGTSVPDGLTDKPAHPNSKDNTTHLGHEGKSMQETSPVVKEESTPPTATKEVHEIKIHENGAISRCSDNCLPLALNVKSRGREAKKLLDKNHPAHAKADELAKAAQQIEKEAKANAKKPDSDPNKAPKEQELLERAKQLELDLANVESQIIPHLESQRDGVLAKMKSQYATHPEFEKSFTKRAERLQKLIDELTPHKDSPDPTLRNKASQDIKDLVKQLEHLNNELEKRIANVAKKDISKDFKYSEKEKDGKKYKIAEGKLGVPGEVMEHRSSSDQSGVSKGTGDDAGHLIANLFGGAGGVENLSKQNFISNEYGTWKQLENSFAEKLKAGVEITAKVTDITRAGEDRPFMRRAEWTEKTADGKVTHHQMDYMNPHTPESRKAQGVAPTVPQGNEPKIYDWNEARRKRGLPEYNPDEHATKVPASAATTQEAPKAIKPQPENTDAHIAQNLTQLEQGDPASIKSLLQNHGYWKGLIEKLLSDGDKNKILIEQIQKYRRQVVEDLKKRYNGKELPGAGDKPVSDVDINLNGPNAGQNVIKAEKEMRALFGDDWSKILRLNFYSDGSRLMFFEKVRSSMSAKDVAHFDTKVTHLTQEYSLAKMLQHAEGNPQSIKRVEKMIDKLPANQQKRIREIASMSPAAQLERRNALHLEVDQLVKDYNKLDPSDAQRQKIAQQITEKQMEINLYTEEAYIGPGAVKFILDQKAKFSTNQAVQGIYANLEMIEHVLHQHNGNIASAGRSYEIYKYMYRISEIMSFKQMDLFFDHLNKKIYKNRGGSETMSDAELKSLFNDFMGYVEMYLEENTVKASP